MLGSYTVLASTLNHKKQAIYEYRHNAPFIEGDTRTILYDGETEDIKQTFHGDTRSGGWYDE